MASSVACRARPWVGPCVLGSRDAWLAAAGGRSMARMSYELQGRRAVVTGASSGIGAATARALAAGGGHVTLLARRRDRIEALATELGGDFIAADVAALDVSGDFDLVIANAGVMLPSPAEESDASELARMLDANVIGLVNTVRAFAPGLLAAA